MVLVQRHKSCRDCGGCAGSSSGQNNFLEAKNTAQASPGDLVQVDLKTKYLYLAAFLVYILPVLALLIGTLVGTAAVEAFGFTEKSVMWSLGPGVLLMIITFFLLRLQDRRLRESGRFQAQITRIEENRRK